MMKSDDTHPVGRRGETLAAEYLQRHGFTILQRNYRFARAEIDIVAEKDGLLVFVEVKTARSLRMGDPITWVTERKQRQIALAAQHYLQTHQIVDRDCRFDVVGVVVRQGEPIITHIENAFWLE